MLAQQTSTPPPAPPSVASKLQEYEGKYQDNLRKIQAPILQLYLTDLNSLLAGVSLASDKEAVKAEIARVEKAIADAGVFDFSPPQPAALAATRKRPGVIFTLEPREASIAAVTRSAGEAVTPIGMAAWTLSSLPAGRYTFVIHYTCPKMPPAAKLSLSFAGITKERELKPGPAAEEAKTDRILALPMTLTTDATKEPLKLSATPGSEPWFFVRQIVIIKPKEP